MTFDYFCYISKPCNDDVDCKIDETCHFGAGSRDASFSYQTRVGSCRKGEQDMKAEFERQEKYLKEFDGYINKPSKDFRKKYIKYLKDDAEYKKTKPTKTRAGRELGK